MQEKLENKNPPSENNRTHDFTQQLRSPTVAHSRLSVRRRDLHKQCYYYQPSFWAAQAVCLAASLPVLPALLAKNRWTQTKQTSANFNFLFAAINLVSLDIRLRYIQSNLIYVHQPIQDFFLDFQYQGGVRSTVSGVFEDLKFKISEGYKQN